MGEISLYETQRLAAVRRYDILDTPPDGAFDRITSLAADLFDVPISVISLVDHDRIWFKSHFGLEVSEIGREQGLCSSAVVHDTPWILADAKLDPRALSNSLVAGDFGLRFYLGIPLHTHDGFNLGTLCVIDREPKTVTQRQIDQLKNLAAIVMDEMELRLAARVAVSKLSDALKKKDEALCSADFMALELEHRVRNSLQIVGMHLQLQAIKSSDQEIRTELMRASARVSAVARVHEHVSTRMNSEDSDVADYLRRLCKDLSTAGGNTVRGPSVGFAEIRIPTDLIVSLGLIVNELVTNATKQGARIVTVEISQTNENGLLMTVSDDAGGLPADFDADKTSGLGMTVVSKAVSALKGALTHERSADGKGTMFSVSFIV